jgi:hypothetical protein
MMFIAGIGTRLAAYRAPLTLFVYLIYRILQGFLKRPPLLSWTFVKP